MLTISCLRVSKAHDAKKENYQRKLLGYENAVFKTYGFSPYRNVRVLLSNSSTGYYSELNGTHCSVVYKRLTS